MTSYSQKFHSNKSKSPKNQSPKNSETVVYGTNDQYDNSERIAEPQTSSTLKPKVLGNRGLASAMSKHSMSELDGRNKNY